MDLLDFFYIGSSERQTKKGKRIQSLILASTSRSQYDFFYPQFAARLNSLTIQEAFEAITTVRDSPTSSSTTSSLSSSSSPPKRPPFKNLQLYTENIPSINRFLIANPKTFLLNEQLAKAYGVSFERLFTIFQKYKDQNPKFQYYLEHPTEIVHDLSVLSYILPVIYVAEYSLSLGVLGLQLNGKSIQMIHEKHTKDMKFVNTFEKVKDIFPYYKGIREKELYHGGYEKKGSKLLMLHRQPNFPMNRKFRSLPGKPEFEFFYSPEVVRLQMIKFFQYSTQWSPTQLDMQCGDNLWFVFDGTPELVFSDDNDLQYPLFSRVVNSFKSKEFEQTLIYSNSPEVQKKRKMILRASRPAGRLESPSIRDALAEERQKQSDLTSSSSSSSSFSSSESFQSGSNSGPSSSNPYSDNLFKPKIPTSPQSAPPKTTKTATASPSRDQKVQRPIEEEMIDLDQRLKELAERFSRNEDGEESDFDEAFFEASKRRMDQAKKDLSSTQSTKKKTDKSAKSQPREEEEEEEDTDSLLDDFFRF